ncbi:MAG: glycosyltransferase [Patescibacteria group bacterium]
MIKIGIECESGEGDSWGIGRTVKELIKNLPKTEEFKFIYYYKGKIPSFSLYYYIILPIKIWLTKPDIVFFPNYMLPYGIFCKTIVALTEDLHREMHGKDLPFRYRLAYKIFSNHAARKATMISVYSKTSGKNVAKLFGIDSRRIFVNYLGITPSSPPYDKGEGGYVLYVGQMFPRRHARETILACKKLGVKLIVVGVDKYNPKLNLDVEYYERVTDEKLEELYKNARLFVYVSDTEAFGLPPLEALARGVRPVVADTDVAHELLGDYAIYCQPTVDGIADGISRGLAMPKPALTNNFSWKAHTDRFLQLCRNM